MFSRLIIFLLLFYLWNVTGVKRVMADTSDDTEDNVSSSGTIGNYTDVLTKVTSNTIINISTDAVLSSIVTLEGLNNVTIIGQGSPTVNCKDTGSLKFISCYNVTIEGISWEKCGSVTDNKHPSDDYSDYYNDYYGYPDYYDYPENNVNVDYENNLRTAINITRSYNFIIQNCSFHHSTGQAIALSKVSGNVYINNCQFTHNKNHKGHGSAIYYTSSPIQSTEVHLVINNCDFTLNGPAKSVVYIENSYYRDDCHITLLHNATFIQNKGVPIYISHTCLILNNSVSFNNNKATAGGAIYSTRSTIRFDDKCNVSFYGNSVSKDGGAIYLTYSALSFSSEVYK